MKKVIVFCILITGIMLLAANSILQAQNLVPNPSFEEYTSCPDGAEEINHATGWSTFGYSPDYFNKCSPYHIVSIPYNFAGFQYPASGNAYSGLLTYVNPSLWGNGNPIYREYIGIKLSINLEKSIKYYVSFKVNLGFKNAPTDDINCATNNLGALFTNTPFNPSKPRIINYSQINKTSLITDTTNWTRIFGSFISDSTYQYIVLGNFYDNTHTDTLIMDGSNMCRYAYYYIDNVCVSTDSLYSVNYSWTGINELSILPNFSIYPNPATNYLNIDFPSIKDAYDIEIIDALGRNLLKQKIIEQHAILDISNITKGLFVIKITFNNQSLFYKFLKL